MLPTYAALVPFALVFAVLAAATAVVAVAVLGDLAVRHHRARVARHESIPVYYRRLALSH